MYNKKLYIGIVIFLIFIFISSLVFLFIPKKNLGQSSQVTPRPTPPPYFIPTQKPSLSTTKYPTASPVISPQTKQLIDNVTVNNIKAGITESDMGTKGLRIYGEYAIETVYSKSGETDDANVLLKNINGTWTIILGPGTDFPEEDLAPLNLPFEVKNQIQIIP